MFKNISQLYLKIKCYLPNVIKKTENKYYFHAFLLLPVTFALIYRNAAVKPGSILCRNSSVFIRTNPYLNSAYSERSAVSRELFTDGYGLLRRTAEINPAGRDLRIPVCCVLNISPLR